jgi:mannose-1-phosphate guanylyltransferase
MAKRSRHVAILAGGSGTRFWPVGRRSRPKQLLALDGDDPRPLLRATYERVRPLCDAKGPFVVAAKGLAKELRALLPEVPADRMLLEPVPRNTAAAVALAAHAVACEGGDAPFAVVPSDHHAAPDAAYRAILAAMVDRAGASGRMTTLGLRPTFPATGYGWLEVGEQRATTRTGPIHAVRRYVEKPSLAVATRYVRGGRHLWNLGTFAFRPSVFLRALRLHLPEAARALAPVLSTKAFRPRLAAAFAACPSVSVDYGVMEKADDLEVLAARFDWDDLGSWDAVARHARTDLAGSSASPADVLVDTSGCLVRTTDGTPVALVGVSDLLVVRTKDALLVARKGRGEDVRKVVEALRAAGREELLR